MRTLTQTIHSTQTRTVTTFYDEQDIFVIKLYIEIRFKSARVEISVGSIKFVDSISDMTNDSLFSVYRNLYIYIIKLLITIE